ncbi:MAG: hypothetical protein ACRDWW_01975 [Acidimicrobiales bacterium]
MALTWIYGDLSASTTTPSTTAPGSVITIVGGPNATANIPGPRQDPADFYGIFLVIAAVLVAVILARLLFHRGGRDDQVEGPR